MMASPTQMVDELEARLTDSQGELDGDDPTFYEAEASTRSVTASIYDYEMEHGRTYHAYHAGKYLLPNDEDEQDRIDIMYHAMRLAIRDKLFYAPISAPQAILDIGTGTGIWAMDVADAYPGAEVVGTDLSPIQPSYIPPNLQFEIADADEEWSFQPKYDLVHSRIMNDTSLNNWQHFYHQAFASLKPGGWVESQEFDYHRSTDDGTIVEDSRLKHWEKEWTRGIEQIGLKGAPDPHLIIAQMREAGFVNIQRLNFKLPVGPWPRDPQLRQAGLFGLVNLLDGMSSLSMKIFTRFLGYSMEELELLLMQCREEIKNKAVHSYWPVYIIFGQKPPDKSTDVI